ARLGRRTAALLAGFACMTPEARTRRRTLGRSTAVGVTAGSAAVLTPAGASVAGPSVVVLSPAGASVAGPSVVVADGRQGTFWTSRTQPWVRAVSCSTPSATARRSSADLSVD
ncbi:MAG TPA: hypothetical protein VNN23_00880, partial [Ornithinibacter sp.]|nr:hypothetical protein [Ornithinibacter sp.]